MTNTRVCDHFSQTEFEGGWMPNSGGSRLTLFLNRTKRPSFLNFINETRIYDLYNI